ncbi:hypothetical protein B0H10DRAFT_2207063 [Mycena sp. CBHHK59/15]|nr:hypothetical protein B0H10DRAFT_2207063 [Mycena sp. CBHHK59/15]
MVEAARLEVMDSQRFDVSKRRASPTLSIQTGTSISDDDASASSLFSSRPASPLQSPSDSWESFTFVRDASLAANSDSTDNSLELATPPSSVSSTVAVEDAADPRVIRHTDVFDKGDSVTTRTIIRPVPRSPILAGCLARPSSPISRPISPLLSGYFSCPSSPANSRPTSPFGRPNSPFRPSSPLNFGPLNCFGSTDAFAEEAEYLQAQRARELAGCAEVLINVREVVTSVQEEPWIVTKVLTPERAGANDHEGLRRRVMEPRATVTAGS